MADMMTFPDTWEEYEKFYGFNDSEEIYTNNSRLIPSFRVKQWLDHIAQKETKQQAIKTSDSISRHAAITTSLEFIVEYLGGAFDEDFQKELKKRLEALPSAESEKVLVAEVKLSKEDIQDAVDNAVEKIRAEMERKKGKWIDYSDEGFVECPFCHSATNCDGNKDELHYCFSCGADMREGDAE